MVKELLELAAYVEELERIWVRKGSGVSIVEESDSNLDAPRKMEMIVEREVNLPIFQ